MNAVQFVGLLLVGALYGFPLGWMAGVGMARRERSAAPPERQGGQDAG